MVYSPIFNVLAGCELFKSSVDTMNRVNPKLKNPYSILSRNHLELKETCLISLVLNVPARGELYQS